ncbi:uncharacterized protein BYT42DRAFT_612610 [Radiomyces spectabilis]|uniref:uncharacterized protein n=1 Tax=Radiomyces spectabilis TaxID=64574 RepID=UPI00221F0B84|nr:uncharacterized protein BYT42DRAFT_612610 [Radiomyces spectabilis]KAI8384950.1 hypothetical protein BYT42DRAFT_612610 [Radiomyces spectabilis]
MADQSKTYPPNPAASTRDQQDERMIRMVTTALLQLQLEIPAPVVASVPRPKIKEPEIYDDSDTLALRHNTTARFPTSKGKRDTDIRNEHYNYVKIGEPNWNQRRRQLWDLNLQHEERVHWGLVFLYVPCPPSMTLFSDDFDTWFLGAKAGKDMQRAATATGNR